MPERDPPINAAVVAGRLAEQLQLRGQLAEMYGAGDPRLSAWDEMVCEIPG